MASSPKTKTSTSIEITTDLSCIDLDRVHRWLARKSYWAGQMPRALFDRAVRGSLCFGAIADGATVGFARVISDRASFAYLSDVFVDPAHRGMGISKAIMAAVMAHPDLQDLRLWLLATADAHGLYGWYGFTPLGLRSGPWSGATPRSMRAWGLDRNKRRVDITSIEGRVVKGP